MPTSPSKTFETFPNPEPSRDYLIEIEAPEFTCLCPKTGQPDFATLTFEYVPDRLCVELKSLKLYIWSFRNEGHFHEKVTNTILNDLVAALQPRFMRVRSKFNVRGGLYTTVTAEHRKPGWEPSTTSLANIPRGRPRRLAGPEPESAAAPATPSASIVAGTAAPPAIAPTAPSASAHVTAAAPETATAARARSDRFRMLKRNRAAAALAAAAATPRTPPPQPATPRDIYIGVDIGTSGCRAVAIDAQEKLLAQAESPLPPPLRFEGQITQDPNDWWRAVAASLKQVLGVIDSERVHRIGVAGTPGTLLLCDKKGAPVTPGLMYNDRRAEAEASRIAEVADERSGANDLYGSLAKFLWLHGKRSEERAAHALHQADWIGNRLTGVYGHSDFHNSLKLGYDPLASRWPTWFDSLAIQTSLLPQVHAPGEAIGTVSAEIADAFGLPAQTEVVAGTTDGVAAFLAAGASKPGHAVTVLGNTMTLNLLSDKQIVSHRHGVYSHRLGRHWLAGGASNSGGAVLLQFFTVDQLREMTPLLDPDRSTELHYYPLADVGERFPINDPHMSPKLEPLPSDSLTFLQGILEGIATIEAQGYNALLELGAPKITAIFTSGSGSQNPAWTRIRERILGARLTPAKSHWPAVGAALLAAGVLQKSFA